MIALNPNNIKEILTALKNGAVLVLPTDTVYGLVCDASNRKAVEKIYKIKKRDKSKPLAVFVKDIRMAKEYAKINNEQEGYLKDNLATGIFTASSKNLSPLVYKDNTIGIRISKHELIENIFKDFDRPLAQTSANISGEEPPTKTADIRSQLVNEDILVVDDGDLPAAKPSKIIDLLNGEEKVLRY